MNFQPYSLGHAPTALPIWQTILDDLGRPHPHRVAKVLGVGVRTVYRWNRTGSPPRSAALALFWLTRWGRSEVYAQAVRDCQVAVSYAQAIESELTKARLQLAHVLALSETGSANEPLHQPPVYLSPLARQLVSPQPQPTRENR
jgi:hypothetical protein